MTPQEIHILQRLYEDHRCVIVDRKQPPAIYFYDPDVTYGDQNQYCGQDLTREQLDRLISYGMIEIASDCSGMYCLSEKGKIWVGL